MKKIISLALGLALFIGATTHNAHASNVTASGYFMITGDFLNNKAMLTKDTDTTLKLRERVQLALDMDMGENVTGQLSVRIPAYDMFGDAMNGAYAVETQLRSAYINFPVAMFDIRAGLQSYALPGYFGNGANPIMDDVFAGFVIGGDFGAITPELAWFVTSYKDGTSPKQNVYTLTVPVAIGDGMDLTPWLAMLDNKGKQSVTYLGATFDANMGNVFAGAGAIYGMDDTNAATSNLVIEGHFAIDLGALTPGIAAWYGSKGTDGGVATTPWGSWLAFNGSGDYYFGNGTGLQEEFTVTTKNPFETIGVMLSVANIQLNEKVDLNGRVLYVMDNRTEEAENSELEIGATLTTNLTKSLDIILDGAYFIPNHKGQDKGNGASLACTFIASF